MPVRVDDHERVEIEIAQTRFEHFRQRVVERRDVVAHVGGACGGIVDHQARHVRAEESGDDFTHVRYLV